MIDDNDNMFDQGTPWDYVTSLGMLVDRLVTAHNELANDHEKAIKKITRLEAKVEEIRRKQFNV